MIYAFVSYRSTPGATPTLHEIETVPAYTETQVRAVERDIDNHVRRMVAQRGVDSVEVYKLTNPDHRYIFRLKEITNEVA